MGANKGIEMNTFSGYESAHSVTLPTILRYVFGRIYGKDAKILCYIDSLLELAGNKCWICQLWCKRSTTKVVRCAMEMNMVYSAEDFFHCALLSVLT